jgi:hypothetical protein
MALILKTASFIPSRTLLSGRLSFAIISLPFSRNSQVESRFVAESVFWRILQAAATGIVAISLSSVIQDPLAIP